MTLPGTLGHGAPPSPLDLNRRVADLERKLAEQQGALVRAANAANAWAGRTVGLQDDANGPGLTASWTTYLTNTIHVPDGFTGAIVNLFCSTGASFNGLGNGIVGACPLLAGTYGPALSNGIAIPSGFAGDYACSVTTAFTKVITVTPGGTFQVGISAYATGSSALSSGSDNVHLSASVIFTR